MSEDQQKEGSEEEKKENLSSQDDDDFGLPDLEFEELEELDLDMEEDSNESLSGEGDTLDIGDDFGLDSDDEEEPVEKLGVDSLEPSDQDVSALNEGIDEVEDVLDSAQLISDRLGDVEDTSTGEEYGSNINYDDLLSDADQEVESEPSDKIEDDELAELANIDIDSEDDYSSQQDDDLADIGSPDELAALGIAEEEETPSEIQDEVGLESTESLFGSDSDNELESDSNIFGDSDDGEDFGGGSIFASDGDDEVNLTEETTEEFQEQEESELPPTYKPYSEDSGKGGFAKVIIFGAILFAVIGFIFWFVSDKSDKPASHEQVAKAKTEKPATKPAASSDEKGKAEDENDSSSEETKKTDNTTSKTTPTKESAAKPKATATKPKATTSKPAAAKPKPKAAPKPASTAPAGEIVAVTASTGRTYVIIGSFIDEDLANDYAKEISGSGKGVKVISPYGKSKRYRVSIADFASYSDAAPQMDSFKSEYSPDVWALKY